MLFEKIASVYFIWKYIYILALEMASPGNQHCANYIGTLSFPMGRRVGASVGRRTWDQEVASSILSRARLRNDPGQVVHTRMLLHQTVWIGTGQRAVTSCGWEGNRGPGEEYWQPPPGARLCRPYIQLTYSIIRGLKTNRSLPPAPTALRDPSITSITSINLP